MSKIPNMEDYSASYMQEWSVHFIPIFFIALYKELDIIIKYAIYATN